MKKTFLSVALLSTMALSMPLSFTSCKDYDDDITEINGTTDALQSQLKTIQDAITSNKAIAEAAQAAANASAKAAADAAAKGDKAAADAQAAMAVANEAKAAAAAAKAEALEAIAAQLKAADEKNQEQFEQILSRLEGVEKGLSGLDAAKIDEAVKDVEAIQVQLKALDNYKTLLSQLQTEYPALSAQVEANKTAIKGIEDRLKEAEGTIEDLEEICKAINDILPEGVNTIAGVIAQRLTSVTLIPDLYVDGIPTIAFESAKYNSLGLIDGEWIVTKDSKVYALDNGTTTAQYRLNPGNVGLADIDAAGLGFVSKVAVSRADEAINDLVSYVPGSAEVDANGVLTVNIAKPKSDPNFLGRDDNKINTISLRVPIAKKHLFKGEANAFVYSEYTRLEETYFQPELYATSLALADAGDHFADSTTIYGSTVGQMVGYKLCYKKTLDLNDLVQGCAFTQVLEPGIGVRNTHTPMTLDKLKSYGFDVVFSVAKGEYKPNTTDMTNQQRFAKIEGTTLTPIVPQGAGDNQACIGKEPIVHMLLIDTKNHQVAGSRYVKIQYTKEEMTPLKYTVAKFDKNLGCDAPYVFEVTWEQMTNNALTQFPGNGISKHDFLAIYGKTAAIKKVTVDGVDASASLAGNITDYVELADNDQAIPVMKFTLTNPEIGALEQGKTKKYVITLTYVDPKGLNPNVEISFNVNITNNIATPTLGATDATKWVDETMLLYPIPYGTADVTVADYNTNILQGRTNPLVKGLLDCGEWSFGLTGDGSTVATMTNSNIWMDGNQSDILSSAKVAIPYTTDGIALVEAATKLTVTWKARLNGLAANTVTFGTSYLQIVKPLKDPVLDNSKVLYDNSTVQEIASLMSLFSLRDAYNEVVANNTIGKPKNLWKYYGIETVTFGNIGTRAIMITDDAQGTNPRTLASLHMSANVDATTKLTFKNEGAPLQNDCYLQIPVQVTHRWGVLTGNLYVKIKHVL